MSVGDVCSFLEAKDVHYKLKEITDVVLSQNISFEDELFSDLVKKHIESNLTIDMVLEKIKEKGIGSLTDIDKRVLKSI